MELMMTIPENMLASVLESLSYDEACALIVLRAHARLGFKNTKTAETLSCSRGTVYRALQIDREVRQRVEDVLAQVEIKPKQIPAPSRASESHLVPLVQEFIQALREVMERDSL
jgi:hypothetical protein